MVFRSLSLPGLLVVAPALLLAVAASGAEPSGNFTALMSALSDPSEARQAAALRELESRKLSPDEVDQLLTALVKRQGRPVARVQFPFGLNSIYLLGRTSDARVVAALITGLAPRGGNVSYECALALARIGDPRAVGPLCRFLDSDQGNKLGRRAASDALGKLKDPVAIPSLIKIMNESGRVFPQWDLLNFGAAAVEPLLAELDSTPRPGIVFTVGEPRDSRALPRLKAYATQPHETGRLTIPATCALRKLNSPEAIEIIRGLQRNSASEDIRLRHRLKKMKKATLSSEERRKESFR